MHRPLLLGVFLAAGCSQEAARPPAPPPELGPCGDAVTSAAARPVVQAVALHASFYERTRFGAAIEVGMGHDLETAARATELHGFVEAWACGAIWTYDWPPTAVTVPSDGWPKPRERGPLRPPPLPGRFEAEATALLSVELGYDYQAISAAPVLWVGQAAKRVGLRPRFEGAPGGGCMIVDAETGELRALFVRSGDDVVSVRFRGLAFIAADPYPDCEHGQGLDRVDPWLNHGPVDPFAPALPSGAAPVRDPWR